MAVDEGEETEPREAGHRRSPLGRLWRHLGDTSQVQTALGTLAAGAMWFVAKTNRLTIEAPFDYATADLSRPMIITMWHGQHFLLPAVRRRDQRCVALASRHRDGTINAVAARRFGIGTIHGSAAREPDQVMEAGGVSGFLKLRRAIRDGSSVTLTADLSHTVARRAGMGIIRLARASGAPIVPVALATSRRIELNTWDRAAINMPFGRSAMVVGEEIRVPHGADDAAMEAARRAVEDELNRVTERAYAIVDRRDG